MEQTLKKKMMISSSFFISAWLVHACNALFISGPESSLRVPGKDVFENDRGLSALPP